MRILHTSDWHLGRSFHRVGLLDAQSAYIDHLVETVASRGRRRRRGQRRHLRPRPAADRRRSSLPTMRCAGWSVDRVPRRADQWQPRLGADGLASPADLIDAAGVHLRTDPIASARRCHPRRARRRRDLRPSLSRARGRPRAVGAACRSHQPAMDEAMARVRGRPRQRAALTPGRW